MSHFHPAHLEHEGQTFDFSVAEGEAHEDRGNYWHGAGDPSTWLAVTIFRAVRTKYPHAKQELILKVAAQNLGLTTDKLIDLIDWHENYMRWHDGDSSYRVLE